MTSLKSATARKSLPLTAQDLSDLETMRHSPAHRRALSTLTSAAVDETASEASLLHAVMEAGIRAVAELVESAGYAQIAADAESDAAQSQATARRRRPSWADE